MKLCAQLHLAVKACMIRTSSSVLLAHPISPSCQILQCVGEHLARHTNLEFSKESILERGIEKSPIIQEPWRELYGWQNSCMLSPFGLSLVGHTCFEWIVWCFWCWNHVWCFWCWNHDSSGFSLSVKVCNSSYSSTGSWTCRLWISDVYPAVERERNIPSKQCSEFRSYKLQFFRVFVLIPLLSGAIVILPSFSQFYDFALDYSQVNAILLLVNGQSRGEYIKTKGKNTLTCE